MRTRIVKPMGFPFVGKFAEICAKCNGTELWKDGLRFVKPSLYKCGSKYFPGYCNHGKYDIIHTKIIGLGKR